MPATEEHLKLYERPIFVNVLLLVVSSILFAIKLILGILLNSLALQADAIDSITDVIFIITGLIGIFFAQKKPNKKFPYGYYKAENVMSLIIALILFYTAYSIIKTSLMNIINYFIGKSIIVYLLPDIFVILTIFLGISISLTFYLRFVGKKSGSPIIQSEASEKKFDNFISLSVILGFIGIIFQFYVLDSIIGLIIAVFIIKGGYDIFIISMRTLLDAVIDFENRTGLWKLIEKTPNIKEIKNLDVRAYGKYKFLEVDINLDRDLPLSQINALERKLERDIKKNFPQIFKIIIVTRGSEKIITKVAVPLQDKEGESSKISKHYGESPYFAFLDFYEGKLLKLEILPNKFAQEEKRKGILVSDWLISRKIHKVYLKEVLKKGPYLVFNNNLIEVEVTDLESLSEIINIEKELSKEERGD
ncbi:MAG: cation diffusion facilitator family transporter [Candidatus Helarchaeota archaeon]